MIQFDYEIQDFNKFAKNYKLSSIFGEDNFFYGIFNVYNDKLIKARFITDLPKEYWSDESLVRKLIEEEGLNQIPFTHTSHAVINSSFTIVPNEIELKKASQVLLKLDPAAINEKHEIRVQEMQSINSQLHFAFPIALKDGIDEFFPGAHFSHFNGAMIEKLSECEESSYVFVNLQGSGFQTIVNVDRTLMQTNHYILSGKDDALYYTLMNYHTNELDPMKVTVLFSGPVPEDNIQLRVLKEHVKVLKPAADLNRLKYANVFLGKPKHMFFGLQAVMACES